MMMLLPSCRSWNNEAMFPRLLSWDMCPLSCHHRCHCLVSKRRRPVGWVNRLDRVTICVRDVSSGGKNVKTVIYIWSKRKWYKFYIMDAMPTSKRRRSSYQKKPDRPPDAPGKTPCRYGIEKTHIYSWISLFNKRTSSPGLKAGSPI